MIDSPLLLLLLLAAFAATPLLLRRHRANQPDGLRVVSRTALSRSSVVAVLAVGDQRLLVGAGERGVHLIADVTGTDTSDDLNVTTTTTAGEDHPLAGLRRDAQTGTDHLEVDQQALAAALAPASGGAPTAGPGIGLVDRLRAMTVRTPTGGRPSHVPLRRR